MMRPWELNAPIAGPDDRDEDCRCPGRRQFLAALDKYKVSMPPSSKEPRSVCRERAKVVRLIIPALLAGISCYQCGKIEADLGKALNQCYMQECLGLQQGI